MRVWVTRAEPGASETAARLNGLGYDALVAPLLEVHPLSLSELDLNHVGALAFTSANAVRSLPQAFDRFDLPVYAVGDATAAAAQAAGFATVVSARGDVAALARFLMDHREALAGSVLHLCAAERAGDLVGILSKAGISARAATIYETQVVSDWPVSVREGLERGDIGAVLVHSPKAGQALAQLIKQGEIAPPQFAWRDLSVFALSSACAAPLKGLDLARLEAVETPDEEALLRRLAQRLSSYDELDGEDARGPKPIFTRLYFALMAISLVSILAAAWIGLGPGCRLAATRGQDTPLASRPAPGK